MDNSPEVLLLPVTWNVFFQAGDDYYNRWEAATFGRLLRLTTFGESHGPALGGVVDEEYRDFSDDEYYKAIKHLKQGNYYGKDHVG